MMKLLSNVLMCFIFSIFGLSGFSHAQNLDVMDLPPMIAPVVDYTNTLTAAELDMFNTIAVGLESWYQWAQVATVIIPDRQGHELYDIALQIGRGNGIGQQKLNNWLLLVIAKDEKKMRIMVWYGLEWVIPDILASQIIERDIRPLANQGDIYGAVQAWYRVIPQYLEPWSQGIKLQQTNWLESVGIFALLIAIGLVARGGYLGSKLWDYWNGEETRSQFAELKNKSGFGPYSWILWFLMFFAAVMVGFVSFVIISWIVWFVVGALWSYSRVISPNFWQSVKHEMYRNRGWSWWFGWGSFGSWFGWGGGRSGGWGSFGGWGAGD